MSDQLVNAPPRGILVPNLPQPQTNLGTLEHTGMPMSEPEMITDIPPDFGWMSEIQTFMRVFKFAKENEIGSLLVSFSGLAADLETTMRLNEMTMTWQHVPMACAKWFNAQVSFKFIAIKPPRVTGKLIVRYSFLPDINSIPTKNFSDDSLFRGICKEWDLGQSNEFEFDLVALNPLQARPTYLPERIHPAGAGTSPYACQQLSWILATYGSVHVEVAQLLQPGGIFPDSIRIMVFRVIKNASYYVPTDPRSTMDHIMGRAQAVIPRLPPIISP